MNESLTFDQFYFSETTLTLACFVADFHSIVAGFFCFQKADMTERG
ncbi:hypothetical protein P3452_24035 [Vibrio parahaemolyticus]|nr:hypothetical protein [Vibrio parahaemolyticus]